MKKKLSALALCALMLLSLLTACGSEAKSTAAATDDEEALYYTESAESAEYELYEIPASEEAPAPRVAGGTSDNGGLSNASAGQSSVPEMKADKIIYTANAELETTDYEGTVEGVNAMTGEYGGFIESSSVSGNNYYSYSRGTRNLRCASITIRIPAARFREFTGTLSELGNVPYLNVSSENITASYYDTESRMKAYQTQETRLMEMLAIAESVEDMLAIQAQLTEVQYQIDSLQSRLTNYDRQVSYSTIYLNVSEVEEYTAPPAPVAKTYWQKMGDGFVESLKSVGEFFTDLFLWLVSNLPAIIVWVVVIFFVIQLIRRVQRREAEKGISTFRRRRKERKALKNAENSEPVVPAAPEDKQE